MNEQDYKNKLTIAIKILHETYGMSYIDIAYELRIGTKLITKLITEEE